MRSVTAVGVRGIDETLRRRPPRSHRRSSHLRLLVPAIALAVLATGATVGSAAQPPPPPYPPGDLPIATGERGSVYYSYGLGMLNATRRALPDLEPYLRVSPSSQRNVELLARGEVQMAFSRADVAANLPRGQTDSLRALARLYDDYLHLVVRDDSPIDDLEGLRGKRVSIGLPESGIQRTVLDLLREAGMTQADFTAERFGATESGQKLRTGTIDAYFFFGGVPTQGLVDLNLIGPRLRLVDLAEWAPKLREGYGGFYTTLTVPSSTYGMAPITTVGVPTYLLAPEKMDPELAYALTAMLFTQQSLLEGAHPAAKRLNRRAAINTRPIRLHDGAARYYRDTKI